MSLYDDFDNDEDRKGSIPMGLMTIGALGVIALIIIIVVIANGGGRPKKKGELKPPSDIAKENVSDNGVRTEKKEYPLGESTLRSDDLDFWDMYKDGAPEHQKIRDEQGLKYEENLKKMEEEKEEEEKENDLSEGGTKTEVILPDGTSQWIMIDPYLKKNDYDYVGLVVEEPFVRYYSDGKKISRQGVIIDKDMGTINFDDVRKAGVEFVMIRIGKRGYQTGEITEEGYGYEYIRAAYDAGLQVGVSFYSQATTPEEALEEAVAVTNTLSMLEFTPKYPVCFELEGVNNDTSRTSGLTKDELTTITKAFCDTIRDAGFTPIIYGNKYRLLRKLDLRKLEKERVFLSQEKDLPDYPYEFDMWEYKNDAKVDGIAEKVPLCISFVDYEMR